MNHGDRAMKKDQAVSSPLMASIHETAEGFHAAAVMSKRTMRKFDVMCLTRSLKPSLVI
jgi:hypothetical protein